MIIYFEIGPLKEREYTGIAQVTAALAESLLGDSKAKCEFFFGRMAVPKQLVETLLKTRNGELLEWGLQRCPLRPAPLNLSPQNVAVFPNKKTARRTFSKESQIIHDLSTLLTPQFHNADTINYHATSLEQDILTNDLTFCVSDATRSDVLSYFPSIAVSSVQTMPLAATTGYMESDLLLSDRHVEPYILALGTIEPRKNVGQLLRYLQKHPTFSRKNRIVILGRFGWGTTIEELVSKYELADQVNDGRVIFPGFVSEQVKNKLIKNAKLVVYPSLFEGFGLPVLEAASLGVPCVTTRSSSLPEAGGTNAYYFDPFIDGDFDRVLIRALVDLELNAPAIRRRCLEWAHRFTWAKTYSIMMSRLRGLFDAERL